MRASATGGASGQTARERAVPAQCRRSGSAAGHTRSELRRGDGRAPRRRSTRVQPAPQCDRYPRWRTRARTSRADHDANYRASALPPLWGLPTAHKDLVSDARHAHHVRLDAVRRQRSRQRRPDRRTHPRVRAQSPSAKRTRRSSAPARRRSIASSAQRAIRTIPARTCGGSSGGAAVALAARMLPLADGSDLGGSLRNPASFCNVLGLRPTPGRVPAHPTLNPWSDMSVLGPMARSVDDIALFLSVLVGDDPRVPVALTDPGSNFYPVTPLDLRGVRVALTTDLACRCRPSSSRASKQPASCCNRSARTSRSPAPTCPAPPKRSTCCAPTVFASGSPRCPRRRARN